MAEVTETGGAQVRLRDVTEDDLPTLLAYEHDLEAVRRSGFRPRSREVFLAHWRERVLGDPGCLALAVTVDGETAGNVGSWWDGDRRLLGYWLGRAYWRQGIGTRALGLFLERERTRPLHAEVLDGNTASIRLLRRHGFVHAGPAPDAPGEDDGRHLLLVLGASPEKWGAPVTPALERSTHG
ncbi:GNAT family N-acetyltransferase [Streptomyces sp. V3I7]|uniref:GNAT family N-acetyltransferase n=1 Tax=Streptomyces sp. V3I7 TaxID=3042278 RepID=UPI0027873DC2|nr:GNAT family protein [Streptomyces sp. V3I7]MDQ0992805.1 RimJ/RimL family protein N-acetyltransferase [Streptomyces sp. V3I7]